NSSSVVMIGPLDVWTTARSGDRAGAAGPVSTAFSMGALSEHPRSSVLTDAARTPRPKSLRLRTARDSLFGASLAHVPQVVAWELPHPLADPLITLSNLSIAFAPSSRLLQVFVLLSGIESGISEAVYLHRGPCHSCCAFLVSKNKDCFFSTL